MPERDLRQRIRGALRTAFPGALVLGWPANLWTGGGWPDLLFLQWPLLVGLEVKQGRRSTPTPLQRERHRLLREHHVPVYVVHTPGEALWILAHLIERLPMAFDPSLLPELEAALSDAPVTDPGPAAEPEPTNGTVFEPEPTPLDDIDLDTSIQAQATADQNAFDLANGTATLDQEAEAQEASYLDKGPFAGLSGDEARALMVTDALAELKPTIEALTQAVLALLAELQSDPAEAKPRRTRRAAQ